MNTHTCRNILSVFLSDIKLVYFLKYLFFKQFICHTKDVAFFLTQLLIKEQIQLEIQKLGLYVHTRKTKTLPITADIRFLKVRYHLKPNGYLIKSYGKETLYRVKPTLDTYKSIRNNLLKFNNFNIITQLKHKTSSLINDDITNYV